LLFILNQSILYAKTSIRNVQGNDFCISVIDPEWNGFRIPFQTSLIKKKKKKKKKKKSIRGNIFSLRGEIWAHKNSSTSPLFIEVPVLTQDSK
jgi:hypothetical protein